MDLFSIRDIENLSGIKAHTLRMWERRYRFLQTPRKESGHRFYTGAELKHILRIAALYHGGMKISDINKLKPEQLRTLGLQQAGDAAGSPIINLLLESCIDYDDEQFTGTMRHCITSMGFERAVMEVFYPMLNRIGSLWLSDNVRPAQEHFASGRIRNAVITHIDGLPLSPHTPWHFLVFTPQEEEHEIPALMAHYLLRKHGHRVTYAGVNQHPKALELWLQRYSITHLFFHLVTNLTNNGFEAYFDTLRALAPGATIVCSGPGVQLSGRRPNTIVLRHIQDMITFSRQPAMFTGSGVRSWQHRQP